MGAGLPPAPIFHFTTLLSDMTLHFEVISRFQAAGQPQKRSLAAAALPQNYRDLALRNVQINAI